MEKADGNNTEGEISVSPSGLSDDSEYSSENGSEEPEIDDTVELKNAFSLDDILSLEIMNTETEENIERISNTQEPDQSKVYTTDQYVFVYINGKWRRVYKECYMEGNDDNNESNGSEEVENFQIKNDKGIYQYTILKNVYLASRELAVTLIVGWDDEDVCWVDKNKNFFMYDGNLFSVSRDAIYSENIQALKEGRMVQIDHISEDHHLIWFKDPHANSETLSDHLRVTGWEDSDVIWINKEAGLFKLNGTDDFYIAYLDEAGNEFEDSAIKLDNAEQLGEKPIVKFTSYDTYAAGKERIIGWTLQNVDYTVKIGNIRLLKVEDKWYEYQGGFPDVNFMQAEDAGISETNITEDVMGFYWIDKYSRYYLTGVPKDSRWLISNDNGGGLFEYEGLSYIMGADDSGLAILISNIKENDGIISIDDMYMQNVFLLNWNGKVNPSPDGTFFYNGGWYYVGGKGIANKIFPEDESTISLETTEELKHISYAEDKGWVLQYEDESITPISSFKKISTTNDVFMVGSGIDDKKYIVGCQNDKFLRNCSKLYYGKSGLEAFEYGGKKYTISTTEDIAVELDTEEDIYDEKISEDLIEIDNDNGLIMVNGRLGHIDKKQSTDQYTVFCYEGSPAYYWGTWIVNWSKEDVQSYALISGNNEENGLLDWVYPEGHEMSINIRKYEYYLKKGNVPYTNSFLIKIDGHWYEYYTKGITFNNIDEIVGKPIRLALDWDGLLENTDYCVQDNGNLILGVNKLPLAIKWIQTSDFNYYDITNTGIYRKIPAWFEYNDNVYVTYDGYYGEKIELVDSVNGVYREGNFGYNAISGFLYSDWDQNKSVSWLIRNYDSDHHVSGWFIYNGDHYYTKDGRSAKLYKKVSSDNMFIKDSAYFLIGDNNDIDETDWQQDPRVITSINNNYYSSKAVEYAKEHVWDKVDDVTVNDDCANYVSYCLSKGGLANTDQWKPESAAWISVGEQIKYLQNFGTLTIVNQEKPNIKIGDPVYYDYDGNGIFDHVAICVSYDEETGKPIVYDHSSSKLIKKFDEMKAKVIATISLPDLESEEDKIAPIIFSEVKTNSTGTFYWNPKIYMINWDVSNVNYYLFGDRYREVGSKKGIFTYKGFWWLSADGYTAINCGRIQSDAGENRILKSALLMAITGEKPIYLTDSNDPDISLGVLIDDDLDLTFSNVGEKSYYLDTTDSSSKTWLALTDGIHIQKYDSNQIKAIFTFNNKTYITFDGLVAYPVTSVEWKNENGMFNRFTMAAKKLGNDSIYISDWDTDKADFDRYLKEGGKETFRFVYDSEKDEQLRTGYFIYYEKGTQKWFYTADGVTAVFKSNVYIEDKFVLPGEGETGFQKGSDGKWIYVDSKGKKKKEEFVTQGNQKFYLNDRCELQTGWFWYGNQQYYANEHGIIQTGTQTIAGKQYEFDKNGVYLGEKSSQVSDKVQVNQEDTSDTRKTESSATDQKATERVSLIDKKLSEPVILPLPVQKVSEPAALPLPVQEIKGNNFLFSLLFNTGSVVEADTSASLLSGWVNRQDNWYYYKSGAMQHSWLTYAGQKYYLDPMTGIMLTGWKDIDQNRYYFNEDGTMQTGWKTIGDGRYYFDRNGVMQTGWVQIDGDWYYFNEDGTMQTGWARIDEKWYYFDENGVMQMDWLTIDGKTYYLGDDGARVTGEQTVNGEEYEFDKNGVLSEDNQKK